MKTLMKKIGGCKKAHYWNMARFQTRRWHREHAEAELAANKTSSATVNAPAVRDPARPVIQPLADSAPATPERTRAATAIPSPGGEGQGEGGLSSNTSQISHTQPLAPSSSSSVPSEKSVVKDSPPASRSSVNEDLKNSFVALRANGWSLRSISQKLGVPKSTLFNWESNHETRRAIDVIKCIHIERLQERYLPSFEEELQKLSTCLARIERALEKQDFDKMKPEFLLRTFLQLRSRLNNLRRDVHPTDTLDHGPNPKMMSGCISRAAQITDSDADSIPSPGGEGGLLKPIAQNPMSAENPKWDKNENSSMSQPSASATSTDKVGTPVPTPLIVPASAGPSSVANHEEHIVLTAGFQSSRLPGVSSATQTPCAANRGTPLVNFQQSTSAR